MEKRDQVWKGRLTDLKLGPLYWYQVIELIKEVNVVDEGSIVLVGYPFDDGVRLNHGQIGAAEGPKAIRECLASCALSPHTAKLYDLGDINVSDGKVESQQLHLAESTEQILQKGAFCINLGGGHDQSFGTGLGLVRAFPKANIGIINFDAHLDLRKANHGPHSGSSFYQLSQELQAFHYLAIGIQKEVNTIDLLETAEELNVKMVFDEEIQSTKLEQVIVLVKSFMSACDFVHLSIDMDVFPAAYAPGVSAENPIGVDPKILVDLLNVILKSGKVKVVDIAELNPAKDINRRTAKLAARLIAKVSALLK